MFIAKKWRFVTIFVLGVVGVIAAGCQGHLRDVAYLFDASAQSTKNSPFTVQFMGNTNLFFSDGDDSILIDGWFTRPGPFRTAFQRIEPDKAAIEKGLKRAGITKATKVISLHSHYDHAMDSPWVAKITHAELVGSQSTQFIAEGVRISEERQGREFDLAFKRVGKSPEPFKVGKFTVTMIEGDHGLIPRLAGTVDRDGNDALSAPLVPPAKRGAYKMGPAYAILIEHSGKRVLVQGSTGFLPGPMRDIRADTVFLGLGGIMLTSDAYKNNYWCGVVEHVEAKQVFPIHWDSLTDDLAEKPQAPSALFDTLGGVRTKDALKWVKQKGDEHGVPVALLPMWDKVDPFVYGLEHRCERTGRRCP